MANSTYIVLGHRNESIGSISVDSTKVRGEGGPINPQLVVPLDIRLGNQPDEAMLAIGRLRALLGTDQEVWPVTAICPPVCEELVGGPYGFRVHSEPSGQGDTRIELRFFLTPAQVEDLEGRRHAADADVFYLYLRLEPTVVGLKKFNMHTPGEPPTSGIWDAEYGGYAELAVFWQVNQSPAALRVDVETSTWARRRSARSPRYSPSGLGGPARTAG